MPQKLLLSTTFFLTLTATVLFAAERPNFVWLVSEDNSKHYLKLFDEHGAETPRIEQLASQGLAFDHAFSNAPVCSVARTTLITGCYAPRIGTQFHRRSVMVPMPDGLRMIPADQREAGYYTTNNSKKDYNAIEGPGVWDASSKKANWRARREGQPFFHMQSFGASHESSLHFPASVMQRDKTHTDPATVFVAPYHPDTPTFRYTYARYHDRMQVIDRQVGEVVDQLEADGLLEDTFVFYFGDHGGVLPRGKGYAYESGLHIPLVVRVPENFKHLVDAERGSRVRGFVSFIDFGPTLLHLAGLPVPKQVDGRPFLGAGITAAEVDSRDEAFGYADRFDEKYDLVRTLRKGKYEYVRNYQPFNFDGLQNNYRYRMLAYAEWRRLYHDGKLNSIQAQFFEPRAAEALYDLERDPHETRNLAGDDQYADVVKELRERMQQQVKGMPDLSFYPESELVAAAFENPVRFGQQNQTEIAALVDIADLSLVSFEKAATGIAAALESENPWRRYWGLIACGCHGPAAVERFAETARTIAARDDNLLVRVRAAEFLGLTAAGDPRPTILDALSKSTSGVETNLILNSLVLLQDGPRQYDFEFSARHLTSAARSHGDVKRRIEYLSPKRK